MNKKTKINLSEVHAYIHIFKELVEKKGWQTDDIYTQQECLEIKEVKKYLGSKKPENIVKINEKIFYVIEAKNERKKINQALKEAKENYADEINKSNKIKALFATGIAGNQEEGFIAKSQYFRNGKWEDITENKTEITGLLSKKQVDTILKNDSPSVQDVEITEEEFLKSAENINEILHENSINKDYRARFISALLLALSEGEDLNLNEDSGVIINTANTKVDLILKKHNKGEFSRFIRIDTPSNVDNHTKVKNAIIKTVQELLALNIRSAMKSGKDILGKFYEVFLKYGNGAKEIGIVLTPRHITRFSAEVLDIQPNDLVLDPACGTGGFLVSAYDEVGRKVKNEEEFKNFKLNGLYGIEDQDPVIALAIVNMIFRGDGKNNMIEGNCFNKWLTAKQKNGSVYAEYLSEETESRIPPITKVLMNPPFAQKKSENKEYKFIEHALKQMQNGGILFSILPISVLVENETKSWRRDVLLKNNRLLSVITFPEDLFYPTSVGSVGIFIKKGEPHNFDEHKVYFARCIQDGFAKKKGKRLKSNRVRNMLEEIKDELKSFIKNQGIRIKNMPEFKKVCLLDKNDINTELVPEAYIDSRIPTAKEIEEGIEEIVREAIAFKIKFYNKLKNKNDNDN